MVNGELLIINGSCRPHGAMLSTPTGREKIERKEKRLFKAQGSMFNVDLLLGHWFLSAFFTYILQICKTRQERRPAITGAPATLFSPTVFSSKRPGCIAAGPSFPKHSVAALANRHCPCLMQRRTSRARGKEKRLLKAQGSMFNVTRLRASGFGFRISTNDGTGALSQINRPGRMPAAFGCTTTYDSVVPCNQRNSRRLTSRTPFLKTDSRRKKDERKDKEKRLFKVKGSRFNVTRLAAFAFLLRVLGFDFRISSEGGGDYPSTRGGAFPIPRGGDYPFPRDGDYPFPRGGDYPSPRGGGYPSPCGGACPSPRGGAFLFVLPLAFVYCPVCTPPAPPSSWLSNFPKNNLGGRGVHPGLF
ncbi:MAG: hypothetical protein GY765_16270 [bacterium]|nr:hypothetical protein [bacterium]